MVSLFVAAFNMFDAHSRSHRARSIHGLEVIQGSNGASERIMATAIGDRLTFITAVALHAEIERLVPSYQLDRLNLFGGNDVATEPGFVPLSAFAGAGLASSAHDGLFTSGTLGQHSIALRELERHQKAEVAETAAD